MISPLQHRKWTDFRTLSQVHIDQAFRECGDSKPTLVLLQALALSTFQQLIRGARGLAWRSLGTCVRVAYELDLHLVDSDEREEDINFTDKAAPSWCFDEEKRRIWWAIWEMDTFARYVIHSSRLFNAGQVFLVLLIQAVLQTLYSKRIIGFT